MALRLIRGGDRPSAHQPEMIVLEELIPEKGEADVLTGSHLPAETHCLKFGILDRKFIDTSALFRAKRF